MSPTLTSNNNEKVSLYLTGDEGCEGSLVRLDIYRDIRGLRDTILVSKTASFVEGEAMVEWDAIYDDSNFLRGYYFKIMDGDEEIDRSETLVVGPGSALASGCVYSGTEVCGNNIDENCDGNLNEGCAIPLKFYSKEPTRSPLQDFTFDLGITLTDGQSGSLRKRFI